MSGYYPSLPRIELTNYSLFHKGHMSLVMKIMKALCVECDKNINTNTNTKCDKENDKNDKE